jgi:hypothetical protein
MRQRYYRKSKVLTIRMQETRIKRACEKKMAGIAFLHRPREEEFLETKKPKKPTPPHDAEGWALIAASIKSRSAKSRTIVFAPQKLSLEQVQRIRRVVHVIKTLPRHRHQTEQSPISWRCASAIQQRFENLFATWSDFNQ